ncbi:hypothetical protein N9L48_07330 [Psychrosphaera sp.]|nr:hypothetical protein [Psychrosphaera sp.]
MILGLVVIVVVTNTMQQQKKKQEEERRREVIKFRAIIDETEEAVQNAAGIPLSPEGYNILLNRELSALKGMQELTPGNKDVVNRVQQVQSKIDAGDYPAADAESMSLPENEKQLIGIIQGIKKYRIILRSEHSKGRLSSELFIKEDKKFEKLQLKINIETQLRRGKVAMNKNMSGSARQYFEKAKITLEKQNYTDEYIATRLAEIEELLSKIAKDLKSANLDDVKKKQAEENDDLDALFAPKKKW